MKPFHLLWLSLLLCATLSAHAQKPELVVPIGHTGKISTVVFSPDGRYVLSGSYDKTIKLWETDTKKLLRSFEGHTNVIKSVAFSPDGHFALSGSDDKTLKLWNISTGKLVRSYQTGTDGVNSVAFSPDGRLALVGCSGLVALQLWDISTGKLLRTFEGHLPTYRVNAVAFSPNGHLVLSGSDDKTLKLWEVKTGSIIQNFNAHTSGVTSVAFSRDGLYILSGSDDGTLKVWDANSKKLLRSLGEDTDRVISAAFSPDGNYVLSGYMDRFLKLWDVKSGELLKKFEKEEGYTSSIAFSPDSRYFLATNHSIFTIWNLSNPWPEQNFEKHTSSLKRVIYSSSGHHILVLNEDINQTTVAKIWEDGVFKIYKGFDEHRMFMSDIVIAPNNDYVLSSSVIFGLNVWYINTGKLFKSFLREVYNTVSINFSHDSKLILVAYGNNGVGLNGKPIEVWDVNTGDLVRSFGEKTDEVTAVIFSPNNRYILSCFSGQKSLKLWEVNSGKVVQEFKDGNNNGETAISFSPDGLFILSGSWNGNLKLWSVNTGMHLKIFEGHSDWVNSVSFSPDGYYILSGSDDQTLKLWETSTGKLIRTFEGHKGSVNSVAFSPDGRSILSGSDDNTVKIWNTSNGKELATLISVDSKDWVVTTPAGLFDASPGAMKLMHYVVNDSTDHQEPWKVIELDQLKQRYYQPGLLPILMGFSKEPLRQVPAFEGVALPPSVQLAIRNDTLHLNLQNRKGGIGKVSVFINEAEVVEDARPNPAQDVTQPSLSLHLPLARFASRFDTLNTIRVVAVNGQGWIRSRPEEISYRPVATRRGGKVMGSAPATERDTIRLRAVVVGTSNVGLRFAHTDARQMANGLRLAATELLGKPNVSVQLLTTQPTDEAGTGPPATKADIVAALTAAADTVRGGRPQDIFMLYLAGHGVNYGGQDGDFYYLTAGATSADAAYLNDPAIRETYALSSAELTHYLNQIPASKKLLILDVCAAGKGAEKLLVAARDIPPSQTRALDLLYDRTGFYVLAGSAADAVSYESNVYGQGLLTYALLQGMRGGQLRREGTNEFLDVVNWFKYAEKQVPELAKGVRGIQQPFYRGLDTDKTDNHRSFDVGKITPAIKAQIRIAEPKPVVLVRSFQEETELDDVLHLTPTLESELIDLSARGPDARMLYMEAKDYPGAYALVGRYTIKGETVQVKCRVLRATAAIGEFVVTGRKTNIPELAKAVLARVQTLVKP